MSHQVLARKWRPRDFDALVGQPHVVRALSHALTSGRLHHAYLFTGTRGVGKTTLARIMAKAVNCERGVGPEPCGQCDACKAIDAGRFVDVLELDAASNRGVDEMAQLLDNAVYAPVSGRYKVYVIDEVHMLTNHAFNAMLKTLEEPPAHLLFVLATTDPQKVPVTVLSRCMQFNLRHVAPREIAGHLARVLAAEQVPAESDALELIGRQASGSVRDALSLTDQAIAYGGGTLTEQAVRDMLGLLDGRHVQRILDALAESDGAALVAVADEVAQENLSADGLLSDLAERLSALSVLEAVGVQDLPGDDLFLMQARPWHGQFDAQDLQVFYQAVIYARRDLALAPDIRSGLSMALIRMLAFRVDAAATATPSAPVAGQGFPVAPAPARGHGRPAEGERSSEPGDARSAVSQSNARRDASAPAPFAARASTGHSADAPEQTLNEGASAALRAVRAARQRKQGGARPSAGRADPEDPEAVASTAARRFSSPAGAPPEAPRHRVASATKDVGANDRGGRSSDDSFSPPRHAPGPGDMPPEPPPHFPDEPVSDARDSQVSGNSDAQSQGSQRAAGPGRDKAPRPTVSNAPAAFDGDWPRLAEALDLGGRDGEMMRQSALLSWEGQDVRVGVPIAALADRRLLDRVAEAVAQHLNCVSLRLEAEVGPVRGATLAAKVAQHQREREQQAHQAIEADPFVRSVVDELGAKIVPESVKPIGLSPQGQGEGNA